MGFKQNSWKLQEIYRMYAHIRERGYRTGGGANLHFTLDSHISQDSLKVEQCAKYQVILNFNYVPQDQVLDKNVPETTLIRACPDFKKDKLLIHQR